MTDVTGRDRHIIKKALAYAITVTGTLSERQQEVSDQADMKKLLSHMVESDAELNMILADAHRQLIPWKK
jgi:hypothetical protein